MLIKPLIVSLGLIWLYGLNSEAEETRCLEAEPVKDFDADKYTGSWYKYAIAGDSIGTNKCLRYIRYSTDKNDTFRVVRMKKDKSDNTSTISLQNENFCGSGEGVSPDGYKFKIIGVDYASWAVVLACDEKANRSLVYIFTRQHNNSILNLQAANDVLNRINLKANDLNFVDNNDCDDWSNAKFDEQDFTYEDVKEDLNQVRFFKAEMGQN